MSELIEDFLAELPLRDAHDLERWIWFDWPLWARSAQLTPEDDNWDLMVWCAGRGGGKTRSGAQETIARAKGGGRDFLIALVGRTAKDVRDVMIYGESGIMACSPPWFRPAHYPSKRLLVWPNGARAWTYSADQKDDTRGPQHHFAWGDEFAAWKKPEVLSNLQDGLRLGLRPKLVLTTTPRRTDLVRDTILGLRDPATRQRPVTAEMLRSSQWSFDTPVKDQWGRPVIHRTLVRRWPTEANSLNLSAGFAARRRALYGSTAFGRQELDAELLDIVEGALFQQAVIDEHAVEEAPPLKRIGIAVDPTRSGDPVDECGIIVGGLGADGHAYILDDETEKGPPEAWAKRARGAYNARSATAAIWETNLAGQAVKDTIRAVGADMNWVGVTATQDKVLRASPVSALYGGGKVHHVRRRRRPDELLEHPLVLLEDEMVTWDPATGRSPNRLDALVWLVTWLLIGLEEAPIVMPGSVSKR